MNIGFIGLGHMGIHMASNIQKKIGEGDKLYVWNRTASKAEPVLKLGATAVESPAELAKICDCIFMCLAGPHEVRLIVDGENGLVVNGREGQYIMDMSTVDRDVSLDMAKAAAAKGITYVDMPVSGGVYRAEPGTLSFMLGATEEEVAPVLPYIMMMGDKLTYLGGRGNGSAAKLIHNAVSLSIQIVDAEALVLADYLGIDQYAIVDVLQKGGATNGILTYMGPRMLARDEEGGHDVVLAVKDLELASEMARKLGAPDFTLSHAIQWYKFAVIQGKGHKDSSSVVNVMRDAFAPNANVEVYDL